MDKYEIRVIKKSAKTPLIFSAVLASAPAAIRRAVKLGEEGDAIEVWLGSICIYTLSGDRPVSATPPDELDNQTSDIGSVRGS
jgi:hypothetical protein